MKVETKHFYSTNDFSQAELLSLVELALDLKRGDYFCSPPLQGKILAMLFFNPSLRTRVSFTLAMHELGGLTIDIPIKHGYQIEFKEGTVMDGKNAEHVKEAAKVLSSYCDAIAVRSSCTSLACPEKSEVKPHLWDELKKDTVLKSFMKYSTVPVINMESNLYHPCQGLADMLILVEKLGGVKAASKTPPRWPNGLLGGESYKKKYVLSWAYHPKPLPVATVHSQILAACDLGMEVVVAYPKGWELDREIVEMIEKRAKNVGGSLSCSNSMQEAFKGADVICAKSWGAISYYGKWEEERKIRDNLKHWIVDQDKMNLTNNAFFMHCLPVRRNVVVTDGVLDSAVSLIYDQAENRIWVQMALLLNILNNA